MSITRLAPSPTGALHLGNARTFLINWLIARQSEWTIILRIEDLDGPRVKRGADLQLIDDLRWLGLDWDQGPIYQSDRGHLYMEAIKRLAEMRLTYPCVCSRREVELAASAPHSMGETIYPGTCRGKYDSPQEAEAASGRWPALRFAAANESIRFDDAFAGHQQFDAAQELGDFVIAKSDGTPAYQLAVVVDDADMGVTQVIRGNDLLESAAKQILLYRALGLQQRIPRYTHLPLVVGADGRRLAKRHGDTRLSYYRERCVAPGRLLSLLARWSGVDDADPSITTEQLIQRFRLDRVPTGPIVFTSQDDQWLRG